MGYEVEAEIDEKIKRGEGIRKQIADEVGIDVKRVRSVGKRLLNADVIPFCILSYSKTSEGYETKSGLIEPARRTLELIEKHREMLALKLGCYIDKENPNIWFNYLHNLIESDLIGYRQN